MLVGVDVRIEPGGSLAVTGPSGSGKSTLLDCVTGLLVPGDGSVEVAGVALTGLGDEARAAVRRRRIGLVRQQPDLMPELSVAENVALMLLFDGVARAAALAAARTALAEVGLEGLGERRTHEISGGQAQRAAVARALVRDDVALVVADEPTASLDARTAAEVADLLVDRCRRRGAGLLVATHDTVVAGRCEAELRLRDHGGAGR